MYHFAAIADIKEARDNPEQTVEFNVMGTIFILEAVKNLILKDSFTLVLYTYIRNTVHSTEVQNNHVNYL